LILGFSQRGSLRNNRNFEIVFITKLLNNSKVLNPCEISINTYKIKAKKIPPKFDKILGCYKFPKQIA
jgi:hypothetical protein